MVKVKATDDLLHHGADTMSVESLDLPQERVRNGRAIVETERLIACVLAQQIVFILKAALEPAAASEA